METRNRILSHIGTEALKILNVRLHIPTPPTIPQSGNLVVANHISWMDIFAISALCPSSFIAKKEMQSWPLLGKIATHAGSVFIDRKSRKDIGPINAAIVSSLHSGQNVCFFPEATTSPGTGLLPFKAALFESAIQAQTPIQPITLRYYDDTGIRSTTPAFANINLIKSIWRTLSMKEILIVADFAQPIVPAELTNQDRFSLKNLAEKRIGAKVYEDSPEPPADNP